MAIKIIYPEWVTDLEGIRRHRAELEFLLREIALHHNDAASLQQLSVAMGFHRTKLNNFIREGRIPVQVANAVGALAPSLNRGGARSLKLAEFVD